MKKLLSLLGVISLTASGASSVVACDKNEEKDSNEEKTNDIKNDI